MSYGKAVKRYNRSKRNILLANHAIPIEAFSRVQHFLERLQRHYSAVFYRTVNESVAKGNGEHDPMLNGKISIKDTLLFCVMEAYSKKISDGDFRDMSVGDMKTINYRIKNSEFYDQFVEIFDEEQRTQKGRAKAIIENADTRRFRSELPTLAEGDLNTFYQTRGTK